MEVVYEPHVALNSDVDGRETMDCAQIHTSTLNVTTIGNSLGSTY